jgi:hypothetical protein
MPGASLRTFQVRPPLSVASRRARQDPGPPDGPALISSGGSGGIDTPALGPGPGICDGSPLGSCEAVGPGGTVGTSLGYASRVGVGATQSRISAYMRSPSTASEAMLVRVPPGPAVWSVPATRTAPYAAPATAATVAAASAVRAALTSARRRRPAA